jgi:UDP-2,3-diacylglucosamine pyrophosphatase LpxH
MKIFNINTAKDLDLYMIGDIHIGTTLAHIDGFGQALRDVRKNKRARVILMGDLIEAIEVTDKRFDIDTVDKNMLRPEQQAKWIAEAMRPIVNKIYVVLQGNHETKLLRTTNVTMTICEQLGIPQAFGTYSSVVNFLNSGKTYLKGYVTHGFRSISTTADDPIRQQANMGLALKRLLKKKMGDVHFMAMGHTHKLLVHPPITELYLTNDGVKAKQRYYDSTQTGGAYIHPDHRWYINTGSFLRSFANDTSGYAERFGYDPVELGYAVMEIRNRAIKNVHKVII